MPHDGLSMIEAVAVIGPGRMGRQIALTCALGGCRALLVDLKPRPDARAALADARREIARDLRLMAEEDVIKSAEVAPALERIEDRTDLAGVESCGFVQEALPESVELKREVFTRLTGRVADDAIVASTSSTISRNSLSASCRIFGASGGSGSVGFAFAAAICSRQMPLSSLPSPASGPVG